MVHYDTFNMHNTQEELQKLAKDILNYGTVKEIGHNGYSTNRVTKEDGSMIHVLDGSVYYVVEGIGVRYVIHMRGLRVTEIIETFEHQRVS